MAKGPVKEAPAGKTGAASQAKKGTGAAPAAAAAKPAAKAPAAKPGKK